MQQTMIKATSLTDAWHQTIFKCVKEGKDFLVDEGSYAGQFRKEFDFLDVRITHPSVEPLLPKLYEGCPIPDPVDEDDFYGRKTEDQRSYLELLMTARMEKGESYTYGARLTKTLIDWDLAMFDHVEARNPEIYKVDPFIYADCVTIDDGRAYLNQIDLIIKTFKYKGHRNNQLLLQVARPEDCLLLDPPCLRHIHCRIQDGALHFFPYFRSWDLWGGFPANLAGIELLKQYMALEIGVANGEIIVTCGGAHIYDHCWDIALDLTNR